MKSFPDIQASKVVPGDIVIYEGNSFKVSHVLKGNGRITFITQQGLPIDFYPYDRISVNRKD